MDKGHTRSHAHTIRTRLGFQVFHFFKLICVRIFAQFNNHFFDCSQTHLTYQIFWPKTQPCQKNLEWKGPKI